MEKSQDQLERLSAYEAGDLDVEAHAQVQAWLSSSEDARRALLRLQRLRHATLALPTPGLTPARKARIGAQVEALVHGRTSRRRLIAAGGFALSALAAGALLWLGWRKSDAPSAVVEVTGGRIHLRTGPGDFQLLPIGDRAVAFVGEQTEIEAWPGGTPTVRLLRGSVRLMVRRRTAEPFVVNTPAADVAVLGTEFDVSVVNDETDVSVVRGEVEVRNPHGRRRLWAREAARARPGAAPRLLVPTRGLVIEGQPEVEARPAAKPMPPRP